MHRELRRELWTALAITAAVGAGAAMAGFPLAGVAAGLGLVVALSLRKLARLHRWLVRGRRPPIPELGGLWDEVIREIHRQDRDSERHKERLTGLFDRLQAAASVMPDAMVVLARHDVIEWANPPAERLLGLRIERDTGARIVHLIRDPAFGAYLAAGDYREPLILNGPVEPMAVTLQIIPFGANERLVMARDITHVKRLEDMRQHFVADVSHELRTPLTVLQGFLETFADLLEDQDGEVRSGIALMREQVERMRRLVDDLLALSRLETTPARAHDEVVGMGALLKGLADIATVLGADRGQHIEVENCGADLVGNVEELRSAFTNLVQNAVRHTPAGGSIRLVWRADASEGRFAVADSGEGIAERHIPFLTQRFYRVDSDRSRASGGTGLGLAIVAKVLLRHDARLVVESVLGQGSTFTCVFPSSRLKFPPSPSPPPPPTV